MPLRTAPRRQCQGLITACARGSTRAGRSSPQKTNSGQALKAVSGSTKIFSSADRPGLIYDTLAVSPESLSSNRAEWKKVVSVWYQIVHYIKDPKTREDAIAIMASRVDLPPAEYKPFLSGTEILSLSQAKKAYKKAEGFSSIYGSSEIVDAFSVANKMYEEKQDIGSYIDPSLTKELK